MCIEIAGTEGNIRDLKKAIKAKEDPMKVAQTRLNTRAYRPNVELSRDPVQYQYVQSLIFLVHVYTLKYRYDIQLCMRLTTQGRRVVLEVRTCPTWPNLSESLALHINNYN